MIVEVPKSYCLVIVPLGPEIEYIVISLLLSVLVFLIVDNEDERAEL